MDYQERIKDIVSKLEHATQDQLTDEQYNQVAVVCLEEMAQFYLDETKNNAQA